MVTINNQKCYQVGGQLCVREFRPFSELISPPWPWKSSEDMTSELGLKRMHLLSFLWSFDENFKIERALHSLIQLWITCKKALHLNFIKFSNFHFYKEKLSSEVYLQHPECIHQSGSWYFCQGYCPVGLAEIGQNGQISQKRSRSVVFLCKNEF